MKLTRFRSQYPNPKTNSTFTPEKILFGKQSFCFGYHPLFSRGKQKLFRFKKWLVKLTISLEIKATFTRPGKVKLTSHDDTVDGSEIPGQPFEVGNLSHYFQGFSTIPGGCLGFLPSTKVNHVNLTSRTHPTIPRPGGICGIADAAHGCLFGAVPGCNEGSRGFVSWILAAKQKMVRKPKGRISYLPCILWLKHVGWKTLAKCISSWKLRHFPANSIPGMLNCWKCKLFWLIASFGLLQISWLRCAYKIKTSSTLKWWWIRLRNSSQSQNPLRKSK